MSKEICSFCGENAVEITEQGDKACGQCKAVQLNIKEGDNPTIIVNCPKCGYRHRIFKNIIFFGDPTICRKCNQNTHKWAI